MPGAPAAFNDGYRYSDEGYTHVTDEATCRNASSDEGGPLDPLPTGTATFVVSWNGMPYGCHAGSGSLRFNSNVFGPAWTPLAAGVSASWNPVCALEVPAPHACDFSIAPAGMSFATNKRYCDPGYTLVTDEATCRSASSTNGGPLMHMAGFNAPRS